MAELLFCWALGCPNPAPAAKCGRCLTAVYCGAPCQRAHWPAHKPRCKELEAAAAAAAASRAGAAAPPAASADGCVGELSPGAPRTPGVYSGLQRRVEDYRCALGACRAALDRAAPTIALCNGCRTVAYCNEACQLAHWAAHREDCYRATRERVWGGDVHQDDEGGEYVLRDRLRVCREVYGALDARTLECTDVLGQLMQSQGKLGEAEALYRRSLEGWRAVAGAKHERTLCSMGSLATLLKDQGNLAEAEPLLREALAAARATLGPLHPGALASLSNLATVLDDQGKASEAETLYREVCDGRLGVSCQRATVARAALCDARVCVCVCVCVCVLVWIVQAWKRL